ncbi:hypothetical protein DHEL01_v212869 [Diaporthe helianthi]|uniref:Methyltransferase domain-containing protein n=1 Tax=Diaporthe helianthi TaxID=158607 RepID=A0A2P5HES2_DIAHE|nr:hypothetical protein DHEL01_v212869 [Diaporthe helianthi]
MHSNVNEADNFDGVGISLKIQYVDFSTCEGVQKVVVHVYDDESGRTYQNHPNARYLFPNDPEEQDRADLQHKIFRMYNGGAIYQAPVGTQRTVLEIEVATGTDIWAIQYAVEHPESKVTGTDVSRIQPSSAPENCSFIKEESEHDECIFHDPFGFIFMKMVGYCFNNFPAVVRKCFNSLEPGGRGYLELSDSTSKLICDDGFVDVVEQVGLLPGDPWPEDPNLKELGKWQMTKMYRGIRGFSFKLLRALGMTPQKVDECVSAAGDDVRDTRIHFPRPI